MDAEYLNRLRLLNSSKNFLAVELEKVKRDQLYFIKNYCFTHDAHDINRPFKRFPIYLYMEYLIPIWNNSTILMVPKSRQIMISWLFCALTLHDVLYSTGTNTAIISKRKEDAFNMLNSRVMFMYSKMPKQLKPPEDKLIMYKGGGGSDAKIVNSYNFSSVWAMPIGPDKVRSNTFTRVIIDEAAFLDRCEATVAAAMATIKGGGKIALISSANSDSYFQEMIKFTTDEIVRNEDERKKVFSYAGLEQLANIFPAFKMATPGVIHYRSNAQDTDIVWVHYSANPEKSTGEWKENAKSGYKPSVWEREMEIDFLVRSGDKVFGTHPDSGDIIDPFDIPDTWMKGRAIDPGLKKPTACLWVAINPDTFTWYIYQEYYQGMTSLDSHKVKILELSLPDMKNGENNSNVYPFSLIDPNATTRDQHTGANLVSVQFMYAESKQHIVNGKIYDAAIYCIPAARNPVSGIFRLQDLFKNRQIKIFNNCQNLINELNCFIDKEDNLSKGKKPRNPNDHLIDCLLFVLTYVPKTSQEKPDAKKPMRDFSIRGWNRYASDDFMGSEY